MNATIRAANLKKVFNWRVIFQNINFSVSTGQTLLITGRNGSGKSTLVKIISQVLSATAGTIDLEVPGGNSEPNRLASIGLVSPYLQLYDEFSAKENLELSLKIRGLAFSRSAIDDLLKRVSLFSRKDDPVRTYSSGMKQRAKYAFALVHQPPILILDEPMSNLDNEGIAIVRNIMSEHRQNGILVVATNDLTDIDTYDLRVDLNAA